MKTILLIEDNDDSRTVYATCLRHYGYDVLEALDGQEGVELARGGHPDLIIMDLQMPGMTGFKATEILKADPHTARIPVIAVTALAMTQDREMAMAVGCDDYYAKPLEPRQLVELVQRRIGNAASIAS